MAGRIMFQSKSDAAFSVIFSISFLKQFPLHQEVLDDRSQRQRGKEVQRADEKTVPNNRITNVPP